MPGSQYPRTATDWYRDARAVLDQCLVEADRMAVAGVPVERPHLVEAVTLSKQLVALAERNA